MVSSEEWFINDILCLFTYSMYICKYVHIYIYIYINTPWFKSWPTLILESLEVTQLTLSSSFHLTSPSPKKKRSSQALPCRGRHSRSLNTTNIAGWNIPVFNRKYIFKGLIFHCDVSLPECNLHLRNLRKLREVILIRIPPGQEKRLRETPQNGGGAAAIFYGG